MLRPHLEWGQATRMPARTNLQEELRDAATDYPAPNYRVILTKEGSRPRVSALQVNVTQRLPSIQDL